LGEGVARVVDDERAVGRQRKRGIASVERSAERGSRVELSISDEDLGDGAECVWEESWRLWRDGDGDAGGEVMAAEACIEGVGAGEGEETERAGELAAKRPEKRRAS
jgi:hypothetical protein